ncbi:MAG: 2-succinyl-5-enolpyruvyl-6-hydroxy-3-cyclohexene-1-carboxylic-acid synthase [Capnocytophaga sp.]|nr:2-succinyl-5-enolpyruvyl-6-hydroxy-3-cyclohexene-1-carboxylic-acid synthase [Capnocytophaga sp.]
MIYPEIILAQQIIQACKLKKIKHIIISPGSRNAPLTIGFSMDTFFKCYSIVDERCAAFFAMGIAQQLSEPVVVICTSGSAVLNYYPAVSEAFYSNIPLVVISADRPSSKIDIGDGQTIRQKNVLASHTAYNANLSDDNKQLIFNEYELNQALNIAIEKQLPVHINAPFEEPLYKTTGKVINFTNKEISQKNKEINSFYKEKFIKDWSSKKKMILIGVLKPNQIEQKWIDFLAQDTSVIVLTETLSNISEPSHFEMIDTLLVPVEKSEELQKNLQPEVLISFGGMVISKKIKQFLRKYKPKTHYHIDENIGYDTFSALTHHFSCSVNVFFEQIITNLPQINSDYKHKWIDFINKIYNKRDCFLSDIPYSDLWVYQQIFNKIPDEYHLQISNSSPIRYAQLFNKKKGWEVFCNRGTSGIDGSTSTAIGASVINSKPTILITGDLSFFYNSNALWCKYIPKNFKIILVNNDGGGIFRILPADKKLPIFEPFFETPHQLNASHLCQMYGINYLKAENKEEMSEKLELFLKNNENPQLLEIFTPRKLNDEILLNYFASLY